MRTMLQTEVAAAGGLRAFARKAGLHVPSLSEALNGGPVGPKLLAALGLTRRITYQPTCSQRTA